MKIIIIQVLLFGFLILGCGKNEKIDVNKKSNKNYSLAKKYGLTEFQYENGIGPIKNKITFNAIDNEKVKLGRILYNNKCKSCHKLSKRFVAPPLLEAVKIRTPEFILNMILNPQEMVKRHPEMMKQFAVYAKVMTDYNFEIEEAIELLHYLKYESKKQEN
jgi:hypothetical protein